MFTLSFGHSASKNYKKALEIALEIGGSMDHGTMTVTISDYELLYSYKKLSPLIGLIQQWKSLSGSYNGKKVEPVLFLYNIWQNVAECAQKHSNSWDTRHCWHDIDHKGWGCKLIQSCSAFNYGNGHYNRSNRFWYNFGEFESEEVWKINKNLIFEKLHKEIEAKSLHICPFFEIDQVKKTLENLPNRIIVDSFEYSPFLNEANEKVNIRHRPKETVCVSELKEDKITFSMN